MTTKQFDQLPFSMIEWTLFQDKWYKRQPDFNLMKQVNPVIIPRNHLVKQAIEEAVNEDNDQLYLELLSYYTDPFNYEKKFPSSYQSPSLSKERFITYCGT
jgi:uncharacterized protein YdiU (UPF0061 family)